VNVRLNAEVLKLQEACPELDTLHARVKALEEQVKTNGLEALLQTCPMIAPAEFISLLLLSSKPALLLHAERI
jgi:hypothetical protein